MRSESEPVLKKSIVHLSPKSRAPRLHPSNAALPPQKIMGSSWGPSLHLRAVGVIAKRVKKGIVGCGRNAAVRKDPGNFKDFHIIVLVYKENAATAFPNYICLQTSMRSACMSKITIRISGLPKNPALPLTVKRVEIWQRTSIAMLNVHLSVFSVLSRKHESKENKKDNVKNDVEIS